MSRIRHASIPSTRLPAGHVHHSTLTGVVDVPATAFLPARIDDQGAESDCTGSIAKLVEMFCDARGIQCADASRRFAYTAGRELESPGSPLEDKGTMPVAVMDAIRTFGVVAEEDCESYDRARINERVLDNLDLLERACPFKVNGVSLIENDGDARCDAIRALIAAKMPVSISLHIGPDFESWNGDAAYDGESSILGGHCVRVVAYEGSDFFLGNSWGLAWGVGLAGVAPGGLIRVTGRLLGSAQAYDPIAVKFAVPVEHVQ